MNRQFGAAIVGVAVLVVGALVIGLLVNGGDSSDPDVPDSGAAVQIAGAEPEAPRLPSPDAIAAAEQDSDADTDAAAATRDGEDDADGAVVAAPAQQPAAADSSDGADDTDASPAPSPSSVAPAPQPPTPTPTPASPVDGYRLRVPSLGVNAIMIDLGVDQDGVMEVPLEAQTVAWYRFTSRPGEPGNTLLGGHITWGGVTAVFRYLEEMEAGDVVIIDTPDGESLRYVVREAWWAEPYEQSDVRRVIGSRSGEETVTLFTCGGIWDTDAREYSHRRVVTAVRV